MAYFQEPTESEKIDTIYRYIRRQQIKARIRAVFLILILGIVYWSYAYMLNPENSAVQSGVSHTIQTKAVEILSPIVKDISVSLIQSMAQEWVGSSSTNSVPSWAVQGGSSGVKNPDLPTITPEMIEAVRKSMER